MYSEQKRIVMENYSILLVEDNPDDQLLAVRALKRANKDNQVIVVEDGQQALNFLYGKDRNQPSREIERLGVIILDLKLPKVDGLEVLKKVRSSPATNWLPVIMVTSSDEPGEVLEAYRLGANSYINKPVDFREFSKQMSLLAEYWLQVNKVPHYTKKGRPE